MNEQEHHIMDMAKDDKSVSQIASQVGISEPQVRQIMAGLNLNVPKDKPTKLTAHELAEHRHCVEAHQELIRERCSGYEEGIEL